MLKYGCLFYKLGGFNLAKLTTATNPFSGKETSIFDFKSLWSSILGVMVLFFVFAMGQKGANLVSSRVPVVDTSIDPIFAQPKSAGMSKEYV